jgi:hypothetical protein
VPFLPQTPDLAVSWAHFSFPEQQATSQTQPVNSQGVPLSGVVPAVCSSGGVVGVLWGCCGGVVAVLWGDCGQGGDVVVGFPPATPSTSLGLEKSAIGANEKAPLSETRRHALQPHYRNTFAICNEI